MFQKEIELFPTCPSIVTLRGFVSLVRATLLNILKWVLCGLYKKFRVR